ncbi:MAG: hypothetical protein F6K39_00705 [Okeania sp. SIO3B3]|nr:hypothetical protein [Okeania sp. SIO3B3]
MKTPYVGANGIRPQFIYCPSVSPDVVKLSRAKFDDSEMPKVPSAGWRK